MKYVSLAVLALLGILAVPLAADAGSAQGKVTAAYQAWDKAFNSGNAKQLATFYTEDAVFLPPTHDVLKGPAGVEKFFTALFANGVTGHKLELIEVVGDDDDDDVIAAAKWSAQGKDASGKPATFSGIATHVFEKQPDGSLKLKLQTFN